MAEFLTHVDIPAPGFHIDYKSTLLFMGSCFSDNIGSHMKALKFNVCHNPFGVVYNPASLANNLELLINKEQFTGDDLHYDNELWFSFSHYTLFSDPDKNNCLEKINRSFKAAKEHLTKTDIVLLTLGTSGAYQFKGSGKIVNNCHKLPANKFKRIFLSAQETFEVLKNSIQKLRSFNPDVKIVLTVSPIRHRKDGAIENQRSKAALIMAVSELVKKLEHIYYFPAYEIFMDELRDYRFYASDMIHPSEMAIQYIWERFSKTFLSPETLNIVSDVEKINKSLQHRPRHQEIDSYKKFQTALLKQIDSLTNRYPFIDFKEEVNRLLNI